MEYNIFNKISKYKIPLFFRIIIMIFLIIIGIAFIIFPFPGSAIIGWLSVILWFIFIIRGKDIKFIRKIRKWIIYSIKNFKNKKIREHKIRDIKKHIKQILNSKIK